MARKEKPVRYGIKNKYSKKRSTKMSFEITLSNTNLASCLSDSWLMKMVDIPEGMEIEDVVLGIPESIPIEVKFKPKEVAH